MKKMILYVAYAATMLVSCSSNEESPNNGKESEKVSFSSYVDMTSQGRALDMTGFAEDDVIGVDACWTEGTTLDKNFTNNFMQNEALTKTTTGWTYENTQFWPTNPTDRVSFVASYPKMEPEISEGLCSFNFKVNPEAGLQQDFLWSSITDAHSGDRNGSYQNGIKEDPVTSPITHVTFHFRHALSKIVFKAKTATYYNGTTITVTDIYLNNLYNSGTYTLNSTLGKGEWVPEGDQLTGYTALEKGASTIMNASYSTVGTSLLLIPQILNSESTVTIKYTVTYQNPSVTRNEEKTFNLAIADLKTWEQDKVYNYNFNIALDLITFDAVVDSWGNSIDAGIAVE